MLVYINVSTKISSFYWGGGGIDKTDLSFNFDFSRISLTAEVWICTTLRRKEENKWDSWDLRWRDCSVEVGDKNQENAKNCRRNSGK